MIDARRILDVTTSTLATVARFVNGEIATMAGARPAKPLELYEYEASPYCRKVREALTHLDLVARIFPCPKGGTRFREVVRTRGGKEQFPFLVDPNTNVELYESDEIIRYLADRYGTGTVPWLLALGPITTASSFAATAWRLGRGMSARPSRAPAEPLELYSYEGCPFCRIARETLSELEIPYIVRNVGRRSPRREELRTRAGKVQVPYLVDPNTGRAMFESADIVAYLEETYGVR
jgi:glutathione S-transferase